MTQNFSFYLSAKFMDKKMYAFLLTGPENLLNRDIPTAWPGWQSIMFMDMAASRI